MAKAAHSTSCTRISHNQMCKLTFAFFIHKSQRKLLDFFVPVFCPISTLHYSKPMSALCNVPSTTERKSKVLLDVVVLAQCNQEYWGKFKGLQQVLVF